MDTIYTTIFNDYEDNKYEIKCYKLPYALRGRLIGNHLLEIGWLTTDKQRGTAYGHANPSVVANMNNSENLHLKLFFNRTFNDIWEDSGTEDAKNILTKFQSLN